MNFQNSKDGSLDSKVLEAIDFYRGIVLDTVEQELGDSDNWVFVRNRLLKALGDRGLAGRVHEILEAASGKGQKS